MRINASRVNVNETKYVNVSLKSSIQTDTSVLFKLLASSCWQTHFDVEFCSTCRRLGENLIEGK
jgi:hypothetical protein